MVYADAVLPQLLERLDRLKKEAEADLAQYGFLPSTTVSTSKIKCKLVYCLFIYFYFRFPKLALRGN